jgi:hypothetical protein
VNPYFSITANKSSFLKILSLFYSIWNNLNNYCIWNTLELPYITHISFLFWEAVVDSYNTSSSGLIQYKHHTGYIWPVHFTLPIYKTANWYILQVAGACWVR